MRLKPTSQIQSQNVSEASHPVTWGVTTKATSEASEVNFSLSQKYGVGYYANRFVWGTVFELMTPYYQALQKEIYCPAFSSYNYTDRF